MKFLANENFPLKSYGFLVEKGFDIIHVGVEYPSIKDEEVMLKAWDDSRLIITFDSDYGDLVFVKGLNAKGIIYLRFKSFDPLFPGIYLQELFTESQYILDGYFTVIDEHKIRQRKLP
ncbi:MAG: DUF5615 family PIN-like protein [Saprospiraceae bacterium]